ncbi:MAG: hypothetical protein FWE71_13570 [Nocardioidaceae bacterium]|nr:hypothetical protein [Nocardioidaceae bacterium]MCL2614211.1 hypothetical protein [Nocardioidaceae bacterium]
MSEPTYEVYRPTREPVPEPPLEPTGPPAYDQRPSEVEVRHHRGRGIPAPFVPGAICTVVWLMSGGGYFWPMWVFLPAIIMILRGGHRHHR